MFVLCNFQSVVPAIITNKSYVQSHVNVTKVNKLLLLLLLLKWAKLSVLINGNCCKHPRVPPILKIRYFRNRSYVEAFLELSQAWLYLLRTTCCDVKVYILPTMCVYMGLLWFLEQTETASLHSINWLAFAMQTKCVPCEIATFIISWTSCLKGLRDTCYTRIQRESECVCLFFTHVSAMVTTVRCRITVV